MMVCILLCLEIVRAELGGRIHFTSNYAHDNLDLVIHVDEATAVHNVSCKTNVVLWATKSTIHISDII